MISRLFHRVRADLQQMCSFSKGAFQVGLGAMLAYYIAALIATALIGYTPYDIAYRQLAASCIELAPACLAAALIMALFCDLIYKFDVEKKR